MTSPSWYKWQGDKLVITLLIQPRAKKDEIVGPHGDSLKVRITAPPIDGKANAHLCDWLAELCDVPKTRVEIVAGLTSRQKRIAIMHPNRLPTGISSKTVK